MIVALYLTSIVLANVTVALWGPGVSIVNAFVFIGIDLVARDRLHDAWRGRHLWPRMLLLIAAGSLLSYGLNRNSGPIALASFAAFLCASLADAVVYHGLRHSRWLVRANGSNVLSAAVDSVVFPTVAWGTFLPWIVVGQWLAKVVGGAVWSLLLKR